MKKLLIILFVLSACSGNKAVVNKTSLDLPEWINEDSGLNAVGIAKPSKGGIGLQIAAAELDAKGRLAARIKLEVSRVTKNAVRSADVNSQDDVEQFFTQATKEVVKDLPLAGVSRQKIYITKEGVLYVLIAMNSEAYKQYLHNLENSLEAKLKSSKLSRENIKASEEASEKIFNELEKQI